jgi:hypothetical protein
MHAMRETLIGLVVGFTILLIVFRLLELTRPRERRGWQDRRPTWRRVPGTTQPQAIESGRARYRLLIMAVLLPSW